MSNSTDFQEIDVPVFPEDLLFDNKAMSNFDTLEKMAKRHEEVIRVFNGIGRWRAATFNRDFMRQFDAYHVEKGRTQVVDGLPVDHADLFEWGDECQKAIHQANESLEKWRTEEHSIVTRSLELLGKKLGEEYREKGVKDYPAIVAAFQDATRYRQDRLDGLKVVMDGMLHKKPPFLTSFIAGYEGKDSVSEKAVRDFQKHYAQCDREAFSFAASVTEGGQLSMQECKRVLESAKRVDLTIHDLLPGINAHLESLGEKPVHFPSKNRHWSPDPGPGL